MIRIVTDSAADLTAEELSVPGIFVVPLSVTFADGRAESVTRGGEADVVMTVPTFSALITGIGDFAEARAAFPGLEVRKENPCLSQVFFRKPLMIADYF